MRGPLPTETDISLLLAKTQGDLSEEEFRGIRGTLAEYIEKVGEHHFSNGFVAWPLVKAWHCDMLQFYGETEWLDTKKRRFEAMQRDITPLVHQQIELRRRYGGNVVFEFAGPTGVGKSSCMLGLMEKHNRLARIVDQDGVDGLRRHISIDLQELPTKLENLKPGDAIAMDEQLHLVGEGAETAMKTLRNLEDTLRGTQIDLHFASPGRRDNHDASQGFLEATAFSPPKLPDGEKGRLQTRFLYHLGLGGTKPIPLGYVDLDWCSPKVFQAYTQIKDENLERTRRAQFTSTNPVNNEAIKRIFDNEAFQARMRHNLRPTKTELKKYVRLYAGTSLSQAEGEALASEIEEMLDVLRDHEADFPLIWSFPPTESMRKVAGRGRGQGGLRSL